MKLQIHNNVAKSIQWARLRLEVGEFYWPGRL